MTSQHDGPDILFTVLVSFFFAVLFTAIPLPDSIAIGRPEWVCLVVFYWSIYQSHKFGMSLAWFAGLLLDVLDGNLLGIQALSLSGVCYIGLVVQQRLKLYPLPHQSIVIFLVVGLHLAFVHWVQGLFGMVSPGMSYLLPALISAIFWTPIALMLLTLQRFVHL